MAELTPKERLQPSLLDRLMDNEPNRSTEAREQRVLSVERLHDSIVRDLAWLMNCENLSAVHDLADFPEAAKSTVNFGIPAFSGQLAARIDRRQLETTIRECVLTFEPRLLASSLKVHVGIDVGKMDNNALNFEIEADMWAHPVPLQLLVRAVVDLETGASTVESA